MFASHLPFFTSPYFSAANAPAFAFYTINILIPFLLILAAAFILANELRKYRRRAEHPPKARRLPPSCMVALALLLLAFPMLGIFFIAGRALTTPAISPDDTNRPSEWRGTTLLKFGRSLAITPDISYSERQPNLAINALSRPQLENLARCLAWINSTTPPNLARLNRKEITEYCNRPEQTTFTGAVLTELTTLFFAPRAHLARLGPGYVTSVIMFGNHQSEVPFKLPLGVRSAQHLSIDYLGKHTPQMEAELQSILDWTLTLDHPPAVSVSILDLTPNIIQTIGGFENLTSLITGNTTSEPVSFSPLSQCGELERLSIGSEPTMKGIYPSIPVFPRLRSLDFFNLGDTTDDQLPPCAFTAQKIILINGPKLTGKFLDRLAANPNLEKLNLANVSLHEASPTSLPIEYTFSRAPIPMESLEDLARQGNVISLTCNNTPLTLEIASRLCKFPKLTKISFKDPAPEAIALLAEKSKITALTFCTAKPTALQPHVDNARAANKNLTITLVAPYP